MEPTPQLEEPAGSVALGQLDNLSQALVIKRGNVFLVSPGDGQLPAGGRHPLGLYAWDGRFLCGHELWIAGAPPRLLVASDETGTLAVHELTNADLELPDGTFLPAQTLLVRLERTIPDAPALHERMTVRSHHHAPIEIDLALLVTADFLPMMTLRGVAEGGPVDGVIVESTPDGVELSATGHDGARRSTTVAADPRPTVADASALVWTMTLTPGEERVVALDFTLEEEGTTDARPDGGPPRRRRARKARSEWPEGHPRVRSDDQLFDRVLERCLLDLQLLRSSLDGQHFYAAGVPWYATLFGRDSLITATEMLSFAPEMAAETLRLLARRLGRIHDPLRDEEPGKVLHELRTGEIGRLGRSPFARYYGSVDATALFCCLLGDHADWSGDLALFEELREPVEAALAWIDRSCDPFLSYRRETGEGLVNQGWKDSWDGVIDERGRPLAAPVSLVEVQGYVVRARRRLAGLYERAGEDGRADTLRQEADRLAEAVDDAFWVPERGLYAMGLDGEGRPSRALASNQGHLLWARAIGVERADHVCDALMSEQMYSGWGVRTLADGEPSYNPVGYHTGSIWPHDNALIAFGMRRYGRDDGFDRIFEALLEAASRFDDYRLPELFAGFSRGEYTTPVPYPAACSPQAWAAGAIPYLLKTGLGLVADGLERRLRVVRPSLPRWVDQLELTGLKLAGATIDLCFERTGEHVVLSDAAIEGDVEVTLEIAGSPRPLLDAS